MHVNYFAILTYLAQSFFIDVVSMVYTIMNICICLENLSKLHCHGSSLALNTYGDVVQSAELGRYGPLSVL